MSLLIATWMLPDPNSGGIERVTNILYHNFAKHGTEVFVTYSCEDNRSKSVLTPDITKVDYKNIQEFSNFLKRKKIDKIIMQDLRLDFPYIKEAIRKSGMDCKIFYCYHFIPGDTYKHTYLNDIIHILKEKRDVKSILRVIGFPLYKKKLKHDYLTQLRNAYNGCEYFVMLSSNYFEEMQNILEIEDLSKFRSIPNPLSFPEIAGKSIINQKDKTVLIVARMAQHPKNILDALKIWESVEKDNTLKDWKLEVIGTGPDLERFKRYANKKLKRVEFLGRKDPEPYYRNAAIFMMTSKFEGWGITLTEAMQFGCVPISYECSDAITDIIQNGENGYITPQGNKKSFFKKLTQLMENHLLRNEMALSAMKKSEQFTIDSILSDWDRLINE